LADPVRFTVLCKMIARREQALVEAGRRGQNDKVGVERLMMEAHHFEQQIERMRKDPSYEVLIDPLEISAKNGHYECQQRENQLRNENLRLRAQVEDLYARNALYKADIRRLSKTRSRLERATPGRPPAQAPRIAQLKAELESYVGFELSFPNAHLVYLNRPAMEKLVSLCKQATRGQEPLGRLLPLRTAPSPMVGLSTVVSGY
jgi:hypothetical protein